MSPAAATFRHWTGRAVAAAIGAALCFGGGDRALADVAYGLETDFSSRYVFRGIPYSQGPVTQSMAWTELSGLTVYGWGNLVLSPAPLQESLDEIDLGVSYARQVGRLLLEPALDVYLYRGPPPFSVPSTGEASLRLSHPVGPTRVFTKQVLDVGRYPGAYFGEAGLSAEHGLGRSVTVGAALSVGWASGRFNQAYFKVPKPALNLVAAEVALTWAPSDRVHLRPHLELTRIPDGELSSGLESPHTVSFGLAVGIDVKPRRPR
jgi:hypothetical protein